MLFFNLLAEGGNGDGLGLLIASIVVIGLVILMNVFNVRNQKKRQQEMQDTLKAIKPGTKVKTIGGICGTVVEVCPEENTFVLETGNDANGKSYIRFDMVAIYQTDAKKEEAPVEETPAVEAPVEEAFEEVAQPAEEAPEAAEEAPAEEVTAEEAPAEEAAMEEPAETVETVGTVETEE